MKKIAALLAAILLLIAPLSALAEGDAGRIEGPGFDTPEEAVTAYIEAFQRNDLSEMLSTFAIESFVEHYNLAKFVEWVKAYNLNVGYVPSISGYASALNLEYRRSLVVEGIRYQYLTYTEAECVVNGRGSISKDDAISGEEFLAENFAMDDSPWLKGIAFHGEFLNPLEISANYGSEINQKNIAKATTGYGGDELRHFAARLEIAGEPYVLFMEVIRYGDRWYNLDLGGNLGTMMGLGIFDGGLSPYPIP